MDSILTSVKKLLGITEEYEHFDEDIIIHINSVFSILTQIGVGPVDGFFIQDSGALWTDFIPEDPRLDMVKTFVYMKVKTLFDPPLSSVVGEAMNRALSELEWRIQVAAERAETISEEGTA